jgi:hypothetical protein
VPDVPGYWLPLVMDGGGRDHQIVVRQAHPLAAKRSAQPRELAHNRLGERQNADRAQEAAEGTLSLLGVPPTLNAVVDLAVSHQANG